MARVTLSEVISLGDPLLSDMFRLIFAKIPGTGTSADVITNLSVSCQQVSLPGRTVEPVEVSLGGYSLMYGGRQTYTHDLSITFVETKDLLIINTLSGWMDYSRNKRTQIGHLKKDYATTANLFVYKQDGSIASTYQLSNVWCNSLPEVQFDSSSANLITVGASFQYDWWERIDGSSGIS